MDNSKLNFLKKKNIFTEIPNLTIVTPSEWLSKLVGKSFLKQYPVEVIKNGIDISLFKPTSSNFRERYKLENKFIILGVANLWNDKKGWNHYLDLSKLLMDDEVIVLVGVSKIQMKELPINILGIEKTNSVKELAEIYSMADVFVNLTLQDNYPTVNLEAMACSTPLITYNTGGCSESLVNNCGYISERGDISAIYNRLIDVKENEVQMSGKLEGIRNYFNKDYTLKKYLSIYMNKL